MLRWIFGADTGPFRGALGQMRNETRQFAGSVKGMLAGALGVGAIIAGFKNLFDEMDRVQKLGQRFGESVETIQKLGLAADLAGAPLETLAKGIGIATKNALDAVNGSTALAQSFDSLGIDASKFINLPMEQKVLALAGTFESGRSSGEQLALVMQVLGKSGAEMIPFLSQGQEALRKQFDETKTVSQSTVDAIAAFNDQITSAKQTVQVWGASAFNAIRFVFGAFGAFVGGVVTEVLSQLEGLYSGVVTIAGGIGKALKGDFSGAADSAKKFAGIVEDRVNGIGRNIKATGDTIIDLFDEIYDSPGKEAVAGPDVEAAEDLVKIAEKRKKLAGDIAKLEEDARIRQLSLAEKILDAEKRRAELAADSLFGDDETKMLEARKGMLTVEKEIAGLRQQQAQIDKTANDKTEAARKKYDEDIASLTGKGKDIDRSNALAGMTDEEKRAQFQKERANALKSSKELDKKGDKKGSLEQANIAKELTGQIEGITRTINDDLQSKLKDAGKAQPSIVTSSLTDIGGGGGAFLNVNDQGRIMIDLLGQIAANTAGGAEGSKPPEPV